MKNYKEILSAALIVKDESEKLALCLSSIKNYCGQIVVVDTGSSDNTPQIASRFGAEVYFKKWTDDFSESRNFALSHCRYPWILSIDADEYLENLNIPLEHLANQKIGGFQTSIINFLSDDPNGEKSEHKYTRLFRNHKKIRFEGRIHEQISESIAKTGFDILQSSTKIYHTGYINTSHEKKQRNKDLLEKEISEIGDDWNKFNLAETEFSMKNKDKAKELYLEVINSNQLEEIQIDKVKIRLAQIALDYGEYSEIENLLDFESEDENLEGLKLFVLGASYLNSQKFEKAKEVYFSDKIEKSIMVNKNILAKAKEVLSKVGI